MPVHLEHSGSHVSIKRVFMEKKKHTSSNFAFPLNSSSLSFSLRVKCVRSPSNEAIFRVSCCVLAFNLSNSALVRVNRSWVSARERWAAARSARAVASWVCEAISWADSTAVAVPFRCGTGDALLSDVLWSLLLAAERVAVLSASRVSG